MIEERDGQVLQILAVHKNFVEDCSEFAIDIEDFKVPESTKNFKNL